MQKRQRNFKIEIAPQQIRCDANRLLGVNKRTCPHNPVSCFWGEGALIPYVLHKISKANHIKKMSLGFICVGNISPIVSGLQSFLHSFLLLAAQNILTNFY